MTSASHLTVVLDCPPCDGRGVVRSLDLTRFPRIWQIKPCPVCAGRGAHIPREVRR